MKKAIHYLQKQALQYSDDKYNSAAYLAPRRNHEPQQNVRHRPKVDSVSSQPRTADRAAPKRADIPSRISSNIQRLQYGSANILQSYELYLQPPPSTSDSSHGSGASTPLSPGSAIHTPTPHHWVVFIHGGYFRDPSVLASSFHPTLSLLTDPETDDASVRDLQRHVKGYVSINYRLAPHEAHPQDPDTTPQYEMHDAAWPDMLADVLAALKHWQGKYPEVRESGRYLLVGHSVGATLALNAVLHARKAGVTPPLGIVGVAGIYDFLRLHQKFPGYAPMTANAVPERMWGDVSPARRERVEFEEAWGDREEEEEEGYKGEKEGDGDAWPTKRWLILAHSKTDSLVDWGQVEAMHDVFEEGSSGNGVVEEAQHAEGHRARRRRRRRGGSRPLLISEVVEVQGRHNQCWENGRELSRLVREGVGEIMGADQ